MCEKSKKFRQMVYNYFFGSADVLTLIAEVIIGKDLILSLRQNQKRKVTSLKSTMANVFNSGQKENNLDNYYEMAKIFLNLTEKIHEGV